MKRSWIVLLLACGVVHADPAADAGKAFQAFVDGIVAKRAPSELEAFIAPGDDKDQAVADLGELAKLLTKPKLAITATHVAKSGTAAWLVGEISGVKYRANLDKTATTPLRATAFLTLDGGTWHVRAAHWSAGKPNSGPAEMCGLIDPAYVPPPRIAKGTEPVLKVISDAFRGSYEGNGTAAMIVAALSDDAGAHLFGSAPSEKYSGGAAIKKVFKAWKIDLYADTREHTRSGIAPGGDLAWVALHVQTMWQCTSYRTLFVLQKEGAAWKLVDQHYSEWVLAP
jgi:hypothetical protein